MTLRLLIAAVLLAVLAGGVYWSNRTTAAEEGKPAADAAPKILNLSEDQMRQVELRKADGSTLILVRGATNNWQMTAPEALPIDQEAVTSLLFTLTTLSSDRLVEEKTDDFASFGLEKPALQVLITKKDGKMEKVSIGDETPTGSGFFTRLE